MCAQLKVSQLYDNFAQLVAYTHELHEEYKFRYNKEHLSYKKLCENNIISNDLIKYGSRLSIQKLAPPTVMPDDCKLETVIESYRNYYKVHKNNLFKWTKRDIPTWINQ